MQVEPLPEAQESQELMEISVRYLNLSLGSMIQASRTVTIFRPVEAPRDMAVDLQVQEAVYRVGTARAIKDAVLLADTGNLAR